jgi:hypothetical protein
MLDAQDISPDRIRPLKRSEYAELGRSGAFDDERVELLRGLVVTKSRISVRRAKVTTWLSRFLCTHLPESFEIAPGLPFAASDESEPEPDMAIVIADPARADHPHQALLIMEFSDSSLRKDRNVKLPIYAEAGVPEYWIFNLSVAGDLSVEVYTDPSATGYATSVVHRDGDVLRPKHVPIEIAVAVLPR